MTLTAGTFALLTVAREVPPYGFFLSDEGRDVLLHYSETTAPVAPGDTVRVFLFHDTEDRLAATMKQPLISLGETALLRVADVHRRLGCFLDTGLGKQLLLPVSELPLRESERPLPGDGVFVVLQLDKSGRMLARLADDRDLADKCARAPETWKNREVAIRVYRTMPASSFAICEAEEAGFGVLGMIHASERPRPLRVGEELRARVTYVREDGRVNLSMRPRKEEGRLQDADRILQWLLERPDGGMPYTDQSPPEVIADKFGISKAAFKRALGKLMKEGRIEQKDGWTRLKN